MPRYRTPPEIAVGELAKLRSAAATDVRFVSDLGARYEVLKPVDRDGKVSMGVTAKGGKRRTERWDLDKVARYLEGGLLFSEIDGKLFDGGREEANSRVERDMGRMMTAYAVQGFMERALERSGRLAESGEMRRIRVDEFDLDAFESILARAMVDVAPEDLAALRKPRPPEPELVEEHVVPPPRPVPPPRQAYQAPPIPQPDPDKFVPEIHEDDEHPDEIYLRGPGFP